MAEFLTHRLEGAVWGHLIGDAIGVPYEFGSPLDPAQVEMRGFGAHNQPAGTWSDDGALTLALLDSLLSAGFDTDDQARRAMAWYQHGAYTPDAQRFDIGSATKAALDRYARGIPAEKCGLPDSAGNGSLMRILPLALVERTIPDARLVEHARRASAVTHGDARAGVCCAFYVLLARGIIAGARPASALADVSQRLRSLYREAGDERSLAAFDFIMAYKLRGGRGRVWDSLWSAWDAFAGADSHELTIRRAIAYGDDTDTTAAIAGGLAGLYWGIDGIRQDWLMGMRGREIVEPLIVKLVSATPKSR